MDDFEQSTSSEKDDGHIAVDVRRCYDGMVLDASTPLRDYAEP